MKAINRFTTLLRSGSGDKFYALADSALGSLMRFASGILIARLGGANEFADFVLCSTALYIITGLSSARIENPMLNMAPGISKEHRIRLIRWTEQRSIKTAIILAAIGGFSLLATHQVSIDFPTLPAVIAAIVFAIVAQFHRARLLATFQTKIALLADLTIPVFTIGHTIFYWKMGASVNEGYWYGFAAGSLASALIMAIARPVTHGPKPNEEHRMKAAESGRLMLIGSAANSTCSRLHPFILKSIAGANVLAQYGVAWTFLGPIRLITTAYTSLLRPRLSQLNGQRGQVRTSKIMLQSYIAIMVAGSVLSLILYIAGPIISGIIFGESLILSSNLLLITAIYATLDAMTSLKTIELQVTRKDGSRQATNLRVLSAGISIVLVVPGTLYFGAIGAIGSLLVSEAIYLTLALNLQSSSIIATFPRAREQLRSKAASLLQN